LRMQGCGIVNGLIASLLSGSGCDVSKESDQSHYGKLHALSCDFFFTYLIGDDWETTGRETGVATNALN